MTDPALHLREMREVACFPALDETSFTYAFELCCGADGGSAFRVGWIHDALRTVAPEAYTALVEPIRSFLEDVTTGGPGVNGRPLICAASGADPDDPSRMVTIVRPPHWSYSFENLETSLLVEGADPIVVRLRDSFAIFESGRIFYLLTLTQPRKGEADSSGVRALSEYAVLQLQRMMFNDRHPQHADYLAFRLGGDAADHSLIDLANQRLRHLAADTQTASAVRDIIGRFDLMACADRQPTVTIDCLKSLSIGIESDDLLAIAKLADASYRDGAAVSPAPARPECEPRLLDAWRGRCAGSAGSRPPHHDDDCAVSRAMLAFSGIAQGVPDFPWQDDSEIHDSTRPTATSVESSLYVHPKFVLEVAKSWRSFDTGRDVIGTCPYLLLMWIVAVHDERIVQSMEAMLRDILFGRQQSLPTIGASQHDLASGARSDPMGDVHRIVRQAQEVFGQPNELLKRNLSDRLELFRWTSIHQSENLFRYPKERGALVAIQTALGTRARFERAHHTLDRVEALVEDSAGLKTAYAERRTNTILFLIAILSVVSVSNEMIRHFGQWPPDWRFFGPIAVLILCIGAVFLWERIGRRA